MSEKHIKEPVSWENEIVKRGEWLLIIVLTTIPFLNIVLHGILMSRKKEKLSLQNFSFVVFVILLFSYLILILKYILS